MRKMLTMFKMLWVVVLWYRTPAEEGTRKIIITTWKGPRGVLRIHFKSRPENRKKERSSARWTYEKA